jgi:hypothetical protein
VYPVTQDFIDKTKADRRKVEAKVIIDYTDPEIDQTIDVEGSEDANVSFPEQTADDVESATYKWASLDGSWDLTTGEYHLAPSADKLAQYQFGWWGSQLAGVGGAFSSPYPALTIAHTARPVDSLKVVGDDKREEYPVDFTIKLYDASDLLLHTETVTANTEISWSTTLSSSILDVTKQVFEITKWSHEGRQAKIIEFFTSIQEEYETDDLMKISLLEEREVSQGSLPVGNISANEISLALNNESGKFDIDSDNSPLKNMLKPNRRIRAWLGMETSPAWSEYADNTWEEL